MKLRWTRGARGDLVDIGRYIARDDPRAAKRWVARLRDRARLAAETPLAGRVVPELDRDDVREVRVGNYRIVYRVKTDEVRVLAVFEGHRSFPHGSIDAP
jgi:toxin ParE1/3/4